MLLPLLPKLFLVTRRIFGMNKEQREQIKQIEEDIISIEAWCQQENEKIDRLIRKEAA